MSPSRALVTLEDAKQWLRIDDGALDRDLEIAIAGASASVMGYLKRAEPYPEDEVPADVQLATLLLVGIMIRDPDGVESAQWDDGYLPRAVKNLLYQLRDPTVS
ncbi:MAG TPA: head-tail connector protein [Vicinamibacterales bacterium]